MINFLKPSESEPFYWVSGLCRVIFEDYDVTKVTITFHDWNNNQGWEYESILYMLNKSNIYEGIGREEYTIWDIKDENFIIYHILFSAITFDWSFTITFHGAMRVDFSHYDELFEIISSENVEKDLERILNKAFDLGI